MTSWVRKPGVAMRRPQHPHAEGGGQRVVVLLAPGFGTLGGFAPEHQAVVLAQWAALAKVGPPALMQAHHGIHRALTQGVKIDKRAEAAIGQEQIARFQQRPKQSGEHGLALPPASMHAMEQRTALQAEKTHQLEQGKAAARLLVFGLGPAFLIGRSVGHGNGGAIDQAHAASPPERSLRSIALHLIGQMRTDLIQGGGLEPGARLAAGAGLESGQRLLGKLKLKPADDPAQGVATGRAALEHLGEEGPESNSRAEEALPAVRARGIGREQSLGNEIAEGGLKLAQGAGALLAAVQEGVNGGAARPAKEQGAESGEERKLAWAWWCV